MKRSPRETAPPALILACLATLACTTTPGRREPAPARREPASEEIRAIGRSAVEDHGIAGLSIAVSLEGRTLFAEGFGHADLERSTSATAHTAYDIASLGKQFTAVAVLRLVEAGKLSLEERIHDLVPETPAHFPDATVRELLHHTSGFASGSLAELDPPEEITRARSGLQVLEDPSLTEGRTVMRPSESFLYSNAGYLLLGLVVEARSGRPYAEFLAEELLEPAGLSATTVGRRPHAPPMADSLHRSEDGLARVPFIHMSTYGGAGSVCSTVLDLLEWELAIDGGRLLSPASLEGFRSPGRVRGSSSSAAIPYGMGQRLGTLLGHEKVGHTGTFAGGSACLAHYPDLELTIAVLANTHGAGTPHARSIEARVAGLFLAGGEAQARSPAPLGPAPLGPVPLGPEERRQVTGYYRGSSTLETRVEGEATLLVLRDGEEIDRLVHTGALGFRNPERPETREWFLLDGETAGWWCYEVDGFLMGVNRRLAP